MHITIHNFEMPDAEKCIEIKIKNLKEVNKDISGSKEDWEEIQNRFLESTKVRTYFVAKDEETIIGIGGYKENKLYTFFIDPTYHRKGIGKLLMKKVLTEIQNKGYKDAEVKASTYGKPFYESFGFIAEEKEENNWIMKKIF